MMTPAEISRLFKTEPLACWNGERLPLSEVRVSVLDRAFLFGDAIYEVLRVYGGRPFLFEDHLQRLERNFAKLSLNVDVQQVREWILETLQASGQSEAVIYIQVTRGIAVRSHRYPDPPAQPNVLIYVAAFSDSYVHARTAGAGVIVTPDLRWKRCDIKSVNLLANCMAAELAHQAGCVEALLVDEAGQLIEGSRSSLFGVRNGVVLTAPLGEHILPGITRRFLMKLCEACSIEMREEVIYRDQLQTVDELFLTATTMEILPVVRVEDQSVGTGEIGAVTRQLMQRYAATIDIFRQQGSFDECELS